MIFRSFKRLAKRISRNEINRDLSKYVLNIPPKSKLLNIGSGGEIENIIRKNGLDLTVVSADIDPKRKPDLVDDITSTAIPPASYDAIIICEVLEHTRNPQAACDNIFAILKPGGSAFVSTPFLFPTHDAPYDYFRYTEFGLRELLKEFSTLDVRPRGNFLSTVLLVVLRGLWLEGKKSKICAVLMAIWIIPLTALLTLFGLKIENAAFCSGFICKVTKQ